VLVGKDIIKKGSIKWWTKVEWL